MTSTLSPWHVKQDPPDNEIRAAMASDPVWHCFGLANLEPTMRPFTQFVLAATEDGQERASIFILRHPYIGDVISPSGSVAGVAAILQQVELPEHVLIQAQEPHIALLEEYYRPDALLRQIQRMSVTTKPAIHSLPHKVQRLTEFDLQAVQQLYIAHQPADMIFSPELFAEEVFYGVYTGDQIVAAGGTHALVPSAGFAVLGRILTAPQERGLGLGTSVTTALVQALQSEGYPIVMLNVFTDNVPAIKVYERVGFQKSCLFWTGKARKKHL